MVKATALQQARKLTEEMELWHDFCNDKFGSNHEYTQKAMRFFLLSYGIVCDLEGEYEMNIGE